MLVGGWVRDYLLGIESKDFDIEVYGVEPGRLRALLEEHGFIDINECEPQWHPVGKYERDMRIEAHKP